MKSLPTLPALPTAPAPPTLPPAVFLMGPTAAGKTGLALELVERFPMDIISVDSALVYRGMDIGTAKPDPATLARAPHRLIDIRDPAESYSAADFRGDALREMATITRAGRIPLLVGGTMLYFRALAGGLADLPAASDAVRQQLEQQATEHGWPAMHRQLAELDPEVAARIHANDSQRIQRALEVIRITGRKMSELQREHQQATVSPLGYRVHRPVICPDSRSVLHQRIEQRFTHMLEQGFLEEMQRLVDRPDLGPHLPAMRCVGYRQGWSHLSGEIDQAEMVRRALAATRQLAKRQLTWLRQEHTAPWYDPQRPGARQSLFDGVTCFLEL